MDRRKFIRSSCIACLGGTMTTALISCHPTRYVSGNLGKDGITVSLADFNRHTGNKQEFHSFLIIRNETLQYPICVYRLNENTFTALWMSCTHQGTELQVSGDRLQCAAHGSEFTSQGIVSNGPADKNLRSFPVSISNNQLFIDLRA